MSRVCAHHADAQAEIVARLVADVEALKGAVEVLLRASAAAIVRQAEVEAADLITIPEAAHRAGGYSPSTVRKWIKLRKVRSVRHGGRVYVSAAEIAGRQKFKV